MRRLKDKIFPLVKIKIERVVKQCKDGYVLENETVAYDVEIKESNGKWMYRAKSSKALWEFLKSEIRLEI